MFNFSGLWEGKGGKVAMSGKLPFVKNPKYPKNSDVEDLKNFIRGLNGKGIRILVFDNPRYAEGTNLPKYNLCLAVDEPKPQEGDDGIPF